MKKFIMPFFLTALFASLIAAAAAYATSIRPMHVSAEILREQVDSRHLPQNIRGGTLTVDYFGKTVSLTLNTYFRCPPGRYCAMMMPAPVQITLPLASYRTDSCGSVVITGLRDERPVDGTLQRIIVRDNTANRCPRARVVADTEIVYETMSSGMGSQPQKARSLFDAERLSPVRD